jgi:hypothetical protein
MRVRESKAHGGEARKLVVKPPLFTSLSSPP